MQQEPRNTESHQKLEEVRKESPPEPLGGARPCQHLDFRLLAPELGEDTFGCFKAPSLW